MLTPAKNGWLTVQGLERFDEINQMEDCSRWIDGTHLRVKRTSDDWRQTEFGALRAVRGRVIPNVYDTGGWLMEGYLTFDDLLDDGWRVD